MLVEDPERRTAVVPGRGEQLRRLAELPLDQGDRLPEHGQPAGLLLAHLRPHHNRKPPRPVLRRRRERRHLMRVALLVRHLGLPEQDVALHPGIVRRLRPFRRPVVPVRRAGPVMKIPVQPAGELRTVSGKREQLVADIRLDFADMLRDRAEDPKNNRQRLRGPAAAVVRLPLVELPAEQRDDGSVKVAACVIERGGQVLRLCHVLRLEPSRQVALHARNREGQREVLHASRLAPGREISEQVIEALSPRGLHVDGKQHRPAGRRR